MDMKGGAGIFQRVRSKRLPVRRGIAFLSFIICITAALPIAAQHHEGDLKLRPQVFISGRGDKVDAEFGTLTVSENRHDPAGNMIELAFVRFKSTTKKPGPPLVYLAGGPGASGIDAAKGTRFPLFMAFREIGDVIAFDQRGTGASRPNLLCWDRNVIPLDVPPSRELMLKSQREASRLCASYWREKQRVDLDAYNSNESADDLEDLRKALGYKQISLWAISYGTHLSFATIRRHPKSISRAILAGTEGPDHTYKLPSQVQKGLENLSGVIASDPDIGKDIPDFLGLMRSVFDKLDAEPATVEITDQRTRRKVNVIVNKFVMQYIIADYIGTTDTIYFPRFFHRASKGDFTVPASIWLNYSREGINPAMAFMMDCASGQTAARRARILEEAKTSLVRDYSDHLFPDICEEWKATDLGVEFRSPVRSDVPVLFISGTLDARTPVTNAEEYRTGFRNSIHMIVENAVHSDPLFLSSPKILEGMLEFLRDKPVTATRITGPRMKFAPL